MAKLWAGPDGIIDLTTGKEVHRLNVIGKVPKKGGPFEAAIFIPQDPHVAACEMALVWKSKRTEAYYGFRAYQKENPQVANVLVRVLRKGKARGMPKWSCQSAMEHARWFEDLGVDNKEFTLPNEFGPYYNRMIQMEYADLYGFMDTAKAAADHELGWIAFKAQKDHQLKLQAA